MTLARPFLAAGMQDDLCVIPQQEACLQVHLYDVPVLWEPRGRYLGSLSSSGGGEATSTLLRHWRMDSTTHLLVLIYLKWVVESEVQEQGNQGIKKKKIG